LSAVLNESTPDTILKPAKARWGRPSAKYLDALLRKLMGIVLTLHGSGKIAFASGSFL
jgi:hypothetical protein